jgi:hypothetical protein
MSTEVLIHLNITVEPDDYDEARAAAQDYIAAHNIPWGDVALVDPQ